MTGRDVEVVVVGGGIAGLTAAWRLRERDVLVVEATDRVGGRIWSERRGAYWLNFGAHVFAGPESATGALLAELGVDARPVPGRLAAVALNGKVLAGGPVELFPLRLRTSLRSRAALVRAGLRLRLEVARYARVAAARPGESPAERQLRMLEHLDDRSFAELIGALPEDADLLFRSTLTRSSGEPEELAAGYGVGYFHLVWNRDAGLSRNLIGGSSTVVEALAAGVGESRIERGADATVVARDGSGVTVTVSRGGTESTVRARAAVVATPAHVTHRIVRDLPHDTAEALAAIPYGPYVVGAFLTSEPRPAPWDEIYALATPKRSFSMLFNTANVLRGGGGRAPGGSLMVYAAASFARRLDGLSDGEVAERFTADLDGIFPGARRLVADVQVRRWERGLPYPRPGRALLQAALTRPLAPVHLAGDYLGTWYTETAIQTGTTAAEQVAAALDRVAT